MKILNENALIVGLEKVDKDFLDLIPYRNLKVIGCNCTGLDHIDLKECKRRGIKVISLGDFPEFTKTITSTAEHTIGLIIALLRNYKIALNHPYKERDFYKGYTLSEKTLGIIGYGRIGKQVYKIALALGMYVAWKDKYGMTDLSSAFMGEMEELLKKVDIVTLHIPLEGNEGFFTKEMFKQMKPTSYLINTSRDGVIEKGALIWALQNGIIKGAAIDFIDDPQLLAYAKTHNNLLLTNHIGGCTLEDRERTESFIINAVKNYEEN